MFVSVGIFAQNDTIMTLDKEVHLTGPLNRLCESSDEKNVIPAEKGSRWNLESDKDGNINLWINMPSHGQNKLHETTWKKENIFLDCQILHGLRSYFAITRMPRCFFRIVEYEKGKWFVQKFTLRK